MGKYVHKFNNENEQTLAYNSQSYTEPWLSAAINGTTKFNNENWVLLLSNDTVQYGPKFSINDLTNNCPFIYFGEKCNKIPFNNGNVVKAEMDMYYNYYLNVWTDVEAKGGLKEYYQIDLRINSWYVLMGDLLL